MRSLYLDGIDMLGVQQLPTGSALLVRVKNFPAVVQAQGGSTGSLAYKLFPQTIESKAYATMQSELTSKLAASGVDADVSVVSATAYAPLADHAWRDRAVGAGAVGAGFALWYLVKSLFRR